ncbi:heat-inducible transcriptional repressor HrcA [Mycoplasma marinum]|uniref:Heat-inducible transcription repressor HrcA n=1 Tax=Mycoplasma marinum TaxID=1937190 RepID=A0A4V2NI66_9MOLU|nr:heat-inducible transcriptional repressor HrcA [Mycoplasma marinum]TCG11218.1 heat-inducible transcriptional repressor HrcA [Mycoplasma marinum]
MNKLTKRQQEYLLLITKEYISSGTPVGSSSLITKFDLNVSPATVRNEMATLEKEGFLEKCHTSSGRIPSSQGFMFYARMSKHGGVSSDIEKKLKIIFAKRTMGIEQVLEEAVEAISTITDLTLVTKSDESDELCKSIQFVPLNEQNATIVIVTSTGRVESKLVSVKNGAQLSDVRIAVRILKDRLFNTPLKSLAIKTETLSQFIADEIKDYEFVIQEMITKVFDFHTKQTSHVYGRTNIIKKPEFRDPEKLFKIMERLENKSIWESIEEQADDDDQSLKISITDSQALISKKIKVGKGTTEISIIGPNRVDYDKALPILSLLDELVNGEKGED